MAHSIWQPNSARQAEQPIYEVQQIAAKEPFFWHDLQPRPIHSQLRPASPLAPELLPPISSASDGRRRHTMLEPINRHTNTRGQSAGTPMQVLIVSRGAALKQDASCSGQVDQASRQVSSSNGMSAECSGTATVTRTSSGPDTSELIRVGAVETAQAEAADDWSRTGGDCD